MKQQDFALVEDGSWDDIVRFCEQLAAEIEAPVDAETYQRFDTWRPKADDTTHDLREKTANEESLSETRIEAESNGVKEEMQSAGQGMRKSGKEMADRKPRKSLEEVEEAGSSAARGLFPPLIQLLRKVEKLLYVNLVGRTNPKYFESDAFTVVIERRRLDNGYRVRFVPEETALLDTVTSRLKEQDTATASDI